MLSVRNDSDSNLLVTRGLPLAVAVKTIADLFVGLASECSRGEEIAKRAVKIGDFTVDAVLEVLPMVRRHLGAAVSRRHVVHAAQHPIRAAPGQAH